MNSLRLFLIACLGFFPLLDLSAQSAPVRDKNVEAQLISQHASIAPGEAFVIGLRLKIDPTWHTYWANPGDTGLPTTLKLELPAGFTVGPLQFPIPKKFISDYGFGVREAGFGYEKEVIHTMMITPPADLAPGTEIVLSGKVSLLMCDPHTCVPGRATLSITLPVASPPVLSSEAAMLDKVLADLPAEVAWPGTIAVTGETVELGFTVPGDTLPASAEYVFFPLVNQVVNPFESPTTTLSGTELKIMAPKHEALTAAPASYRGLLVATTAEGKSGYLVSMGEAAAATTTTPEASEPAPATSDPASANPQDAIPGIVSTGSADPAALPFGGGLFGILLAAFLGGIILNIMPCVFPVISLKVMSFVGQAGEDRKKVFAHSATFALGILVFFWLLTTVLLMLRSAGSTDVGWGVQLREPAFVIGLIFVMVVVALSLFGVFEFGSSMTGVGGNLASKSGYAGSFWSGALAVLLATPCTAPLMAPAIGFALVQPAPIMFLVFTTLGLGLAAPYFLFAIFPKLLGMIPKPGAWMETFKQFMGFPMLAVAVWLIGVLSRQLNVTGLQWALAAVLLVAIAGWIMGRFAGWDRSNKARLIARFAAAAVFLAAVSIAWKSSQDRAAQNATNIIEVIAEKRAQGKNVFVDFTAEWCVTCKVNERVAIKTDATQKAFADNNIELVIADWTNPDPHIAALLEEHGRAGVPLYLLYPADPNQPAIMIKEGIITGGDILAAIEKLPK